MDTIIQVRIPYAKCMTCTHLGDFGTVDQACVEEDICPSRGIRVIKAPPTFRMVEVIIKAKEDKDLDKLTLMYSRVSKLEPSVREDLILQLSNAGYEL